MDDSTLWWLIAGTAIAIELVTGTFYLLMLSSGFVAAALAAHLGANTITQIVVASIIGAGSVVAWRRYKQTRPPSAHANANRDVNLDIGGTVQVDHWEADGTASVKYRGAQWAVAVVAGETASRGAYRIVEVVGSRLIVQKL